MRQQVTYSIGACPRTALNRSPSTVREVLDGLDSDVGYTTVLKLLQIMTTKGLVKRDERERTHTYRAATSEEQTQRRLVNDLIARAFGGSAQKLVLHRARTWVLSAVDGTPADKLQTLPLVQEHVARKNLELLELLVRHRHRQHIVNVDSAVQHVLGSEVRALRARSIDRQRFAGKHVACL